MRKFLTNILALNLFLMSTVSGAQTPAPLTRQALIAQTMSKAKPLIMTSGADTVVKVLDRPSDRSYTAVHMHPYGLTFNWCKYENGKYDCSKKLGCREAGNVYTYDELRRRELQKRGWMWGVGAFDSLLIVAGVVGAIFAAVPTSVAAGAGAGAVAAGAAPEIIAAGAGTGLGWTITSGTVGGAVAMAETNPTMANKLPPIVGEVGVKAVTTVGPIINQLNSKWAAFTASSVLGFSVTGVVGGFLNSVNFKEYQRDADTISFKLYETHRHDRTDVSVKAGDDFPGRLSSMLCHLDNWHPSGTPEPNLQVPFFPQKP